MCAKPAERETWRRRQRQRNRDRYTQREERGIQTELDREKEFHAPQGPKLVDHDLSTRGPETAKQEVMLEEGWGQVVKGLGCQVCKFGLTLKIVGSL